MGPFTGIAALIQSIFESEKQKDPVNNTGLTPRLEEIPNSIPMPMEDKRKGFLHYLLHPWTKPTGKDWGAAAGIGSWYGTGDPEKLSIESPGAGESMEDATKRIPNPDSYTPQITNPRAYTERLGENWPTSVESGMGVATQNMFGTDAVGMSTARGNPGELYSGEGRSWLPDDDDYLSASGISDANWSTPVRAPSTRGYLAPGPGTEQPFVDNRDDSLEMPLVETYNRGPAPAPVLGTRRQGTSFDANIEAGGRRGGWFTPEEYSKRYYKFGRGA